MDAELEKSLSTISELKTSSRSSLAMVLVGVLMLVGSSLYSFTRLKPLEEKIQAKRVELANAEEKLRDIEQKTQALDARNENLVRTVDQLEARVAQIQAQQTVSPETKRAIDADVKATKDSARAIEHAGKNIRRVFGF